MPSPTNASNRSEKRTRLDTALSSDDGVPTPFSSTPNKSITSSLTPKDMFCLMKTLNRCCDSAYDLFSARSDKFRLKPELRLVKHCISRFCSISLDKYEELTSEFWRAIDGEIMPSQYVVYSYLPDHSSDPYTSRWLASFTYFIGNESLKRVLLFPLRALNDYFI